MKRIFIFLTVLFFAFSAYSQTKMFINKTTGQIDSLLLSEIKNITFSVHNDTIPGLVAWYPFNNNARDTSGNGHHGTALSVLPDTDRFGNPNNCYRFTGSNSYITIPNDPVFNLTGTDSISISCWMKSDPIQRHGSALWCKSVSGGVSNYCFTFDSYLDIGDSMNATVNMNHSTAQSRIPTFYIGKVGSWHHLVVVFFNLECTIYSDGVLVKDALFDKTPITNSGVLYFGDDSDGGNEYYKGLLDDVRIYKRALTPSEVQSLYHEGGW